MPMTDKERTAIVEAMAEAAHNSWMDAYIKMCYTSRLAAWGEEFMVPFTELSERGKDLDRMIMNAILTALDTNGYDVTKRS